MRRHDVSPGADKSLGAEKMAEARELCMSRLRSVPREKREAVADSILALADPDWWESRRKGPDVFLLILETHKAKVLTIMRQAGA